MPRLIVLMFALTAVSGCTVDKQMVATGGSRSDGTVDLSYSVGAFEKANIDMVRAQNDALARCKAWGYSAAEAFGGEKRQCQIFDPYLNCSLWNVTMTFQCSGANTPT
jgi:hypothetical protein